MLQHEELLLNLRFKYCKELINSALKSCTEKHVMCKEVALLVPIHVVYAMNEHQNFQLHLVYALTTNSMHAYRKYLICHDAATRLYVRIFITSDGSMQIIEYGFSKTGLI